MADMKYCKICVVYTDGYETFDIKGDSVVVCDDCLDVIRGDTHVFLNMPPKSERKFKMVFDDEVDSDE